MADMWSARELLKRWCLGFVCEVITNINKYIYVYWEHCFMGYHGPTNTPLETEHFVSIRRVDCFAQPPPPKNCVRSGALSMNIVVGRMSRLFIVTINYSSLLCAHSGSDYLNLISIIFT